MRQKMKVAAIMVASAMLTAVAQATPTPLESAVDSIETTGTSITGSTVAGAVVTAGLGLFAIRFGIPWVIRLFKSTSK